MITIETGWVLRSTNVHSYWRDDELQRAAAWELAGKWLEIGSAPVTITPARIVVDA